MATGSVLNAGRLLYTSSSSTCIVLVLACVPPFLDDATATTIAIPTTIIPIALRRTGSPRLLTRGQKASSRSARYIVSTRHYTSYVSYHTTMRIFTQLPATPLITTTRTHIHTQTDTRTHTHTTRIITQEFTCKLVVPGHFFQVCVCVFLHLHLFFSPPTSLFFCISLPLSRSLLLSLSNSLFPLFFSPFISLSFSISRERQRRQGGGLREREAEKGESGRER